MKSLKKVFLAAALVAFAGIVAKAIVIYQTTLINETALAYTKNYPIDLTTVYAGTNLAGSVTYSTASLTADTFSDGAQSTGSFTVSSVSGLVCASASDTITVGSNIIPSTAAIIVALPNAPGTGPGTGYLFRNGLDWTVGADTTATALSIANAMAAKLPNVTVSPSTNVITLTAVPCGITYNHAAVASNAGAITAGSASWTGGLDNARVSIAGYNLRQGTDWNQNASANTTASNIATAINANASISALVTATPSSAVVNLKAKKTALYALSLDVNTANITKSGATMTGGSNPGWALGGTAISIPSHNLTLAYPVLYTNGAAPLISGLTSGTTYYAYIVDPNTIKLADTSAHAVAGTNFQVLASTSSQTTAGTYTLTPLAFSGSSTLTWQTSDNNSTWATMTGISPITINSASSATWPSLVITHRYIRVNLTGPTTGGTVVNLTLTGTQ